MSYKPDEATLIAYLYGDLEGAERLKVEDYLNHNPVEKKRLEEWTFARTAMAQLQDKEVIAPPIILGDDKATIPFWKESYVKMSLGIAASLFFVLVAAKLMGLSLSYAPGEVKISFGEKQPVEKSPSLTEQQVGEMIHTSMAQNNEALQASWIEERKMLDESVRKNLTSNSAKIDQLMKTASAASQDQVKLFVAQLQDDNLKLMKDYMQLSATGQKQYIESLLVDFSGYLQEQRKQDIQLISAKVNKVQENTDIFKQETEQLLTSLITTKNSNEQRRN